MGFDQEQAAYILMIEQALRDALIEPEQDWPRDGIPRNLNTAMRYSLLAGGKRLRPTLLLAACICSWTMSLLPCPLRRPWR